MNRTYLISYQNEARENFQVELPTKEEADQYAEELEEEGYMNIILERIRI